MATLQPRSTLAPWLRNRTTLSSSQGCSNLSGLQFPSAKRKSRGVLEIARRPGLTVCSSNSKGVRLQETSVTKEDRRKLLHQKGCIVWITGLSGAGKSTLAFTMDRTMMAMGKLTYVLDGDNIRHGLCKDLGFSAADRQENIRRVGEVATLFADAGLITLVSFISPYKRDRDIVREMVPPGHFIEVFMNVPLEVCERRDAKGLYKLARAGVIKGFTGIDDPYEKPETPEITIHDVDEKGGPVSPDQMAWTVIQYLADKGFFSE
ncbi:adenylylsulfate kinase [Marchantia polymorpha subsp. ruderalis]|uniref:Adenylyl-sulfate kinase n=2 Tax=Marchantia polymorpha TaxID=3197 RepID=A0AAF6ARI1_MARPO|nr:hypothetical protein MARPO_0001s0168 [Marchantia polymorpha]BBM99051.1 hypothetical protein Mp_1g18300 [Marchantia polymorpha subsp. ruderalis]|eukprot:PTQ50127.1 hypothetical protein MARPO_0001s0168 [Marchantia polymorpha]